MGHSRGNVPRFSTHPRSPSSKDPGPGAFLRALRDFDLSADFYLYRRRSEKEIFPWDMLDMGIERRYLWAELERAEHGASTPACFDGFQR